MIFVDSSFWIAQQLRTDRNNATARRLQQDYELATLVTSNAVIGETWTYLRRKSDHARAVAWLDRVRSIGCSVLQVDEQLEGEAWAWLRRHDERAYSYVDATTFAIMRKLRIRDALAFDGDFTAAGFTELRPDVP